MRILILANNDVGLYQFRRELIEELLEHNEVFISLPYGGLVDPLVEAGCRFIDTPMERRGMDPAQDLGLLGRYRAMLGGVKPDLVITYTIKPNIYGGLACKARGIPYAANITGLGTAFEKGGMLTKLVTAMYRSALAKAKTVFFENAEICRRFEELGICGPEKACVLSGAGINLEKFTPQPYPEGDETKFLFVGRIMMEKGVGELIDAMEMLRKKGRDCSLDVVGPLEEDWSDELSRCEKDGWLRFHGYQEDVRPFIKDCSCFVLPSWHEGMANTNLECAASARPVITSDIPGCCEAVLEGVSGLLCKSRSAESLCEAMDRFCAMSREEREAMGLAGRKHMETAFDKKAVIAKTIGELMG